MFVLLRVSFLIVAGSDHLRDVFGKAMGLTDQDIVALSGGHTIVCYDFEFVVLATLQNYAAIILRKNVTSKLLYHYWCNFAKCIL